MKTKDAKLEIDKFKEYMKSGFIVIDIRPPHEFANGFIPGALNIPFYTPDTFFDLFGKFIVKDRSFLLVDDDTADNVIVNELNLKRYAQFKGVLEGGMQNWENSGNRLDMVIAPDIEEFILDLKHDDNIRLIDIRSGQEYDISHIDKAENIPMTKLLKDVNLLQDGKVYYLYCKDGINSMTCISYLKLQNKHNIYYLEGGFEMLKSQEGIILTSET